MKKLTEAFLILLYSTVLINNFVCEKHKILKKKIQILLNKKKSECLKKFPSVSF